MYLLEMSHAREEICIAIEYEEPQKKDEEKRKTKVTRRKTNITRLPW